MKTINKGQLVVSNRDFSGVPKGSIGKCISIDILPSLNSYAIEWQNLPQYKTVQAYIDGKRLVDWFSDKDLQYLDVYSSDMDAEYSAFLEEQKAKGEIEAEAKGKQEYEEQRFERENYDNYNGEGE